LVGRIALGVCGIDLCNRGLNFGEVQECAFFDAAILIEDGDGEEKLRFECCGEGEVQVVERGLEWDWGDFGLLEARNSGVCWALNIQNDRRIVGVDMSKLRVKSSSVTP